MLVKILDKMLCTPEIGFVKQSSTFKLSKVEKVATTPFLTIKYIDYARLLQ